MPIRSTIFCLISVALSSGGSASLADWQQADRPREFSFPRDHGAHPGFRTEWWYFTGNLTDATGRAFGFQLTWFRSQLVPTPGTPADPRASRWATDEVMAAHLAVSDISGRRHLQSDRLARVGRIGLAYAATDRFDVGCRGWTGRLDEQGRFVLAATAEDCGLSLTLTPKKSLVLQGPGGVSSKGPRPGQASYYLSLTRLDVDGTLSVGGTQYRVTGLAWMDHEFGSNQLSDDQIGWDWWGLILDDGRELMVYRLRGRDAAGEHRRATLVHADGRPEYFTAEQITFTVLESWTSPHTRGKYPIVQRLQIGGVVDLTVRPRLTDQEMRTRGSTGNVYYEGSAEATGRVAGRTVRGLGYVELVGYAGEVGRF